MAEIIENPDVRAACDMLDEWADRWLKKGVAISDLYAICTAHGIVLASCMEMTEEEFIDSIRAGWRSQIGALKAVGSTLENSILEDTALANNGRGSTWQRN